MSADLESGEKMRCLLSATVVAMVLGAMGCKKAEVTPAAVQSEPAAKTQPASAAPEESKAPAETPPTNADEPLAGTADPEKEPVPEPAKGELDPEACKTRVDAEERKARLEVVPKLQAEAEAVGRMDEWATKTSASLEESQAEFLRQRVDQAVADYRKCVEEMSAPREERDPECVAQVTQDASACGRLVGEGLKRQCIEQVRILPVFKFLRDWGRAGFTAEFCSSYQGTSLSFLADRTRCRALASAGDCGSGLLEGIKTSLDRHCRAIKLISQGGRCGKDFPEGSPECEMQELVLASDRVGTCLRMAREGRLPLPEDLCDRADQMEYWNCDMIPKGATPIKAGQETQNECKLALALRDGRKSCGGDIPEDSNECVMLLSLRAAIDRDRAICNTLTNERFAERCRTFLVDSVEECAKRPSKDWGTGVKDDSPCRKMLLDETVLPATEGRSELRLTFTNPYDESATCKAKVTGTAKASVTTRTLEVSLTGGQTKIESMFFVTETGLEFDVSHECTWDVKAAASPKQNIRSDVAP